MWDLIVLIPDHFLSVYSNMLHTKNSFHYFAFFHSEIRGSILISNTIEIPP